VIEYLSRREWYVVVFKQTLEIVDS
jgi:hypothetical protein